MSDDDVAQRLRSLSWWASGDPYKIMDCLDGLRTIPDSVVDLVLTDPPFNVGINYGDTTDDGMTDKQYEDWFLERLKEMARIVKDGRPIIIFSGDIKIHSLLNAVEREPSLIFHHFLKWHKPTCQRALSGFVLFYRTELALLVTKGKPDQKILNRKRLYGDTLTYENTSSARKDTVGEMVDHPCQRPVQLYKHLVEGFTQEGDIVVDPFLGSGTTAFAGKLSNRIGLGFEINPNYEKVIRTRLMGNTSALESFGVCEI